jgi:LAO/AO transport system kinase
MIGAPRVDDYLTGIRSGSRIWIGRAITLVESTLPAHRAAARRLLAELPRPTRPACRLGVSGVPGAGKSTLIDALGGHLTATGHRVAVLAIDPSSTRTAGSVLGDSTRMQRLQADDRAYVRASPSSGVLGGAGRATRGAISVVEAAGYDVVLVETVGVGQSETAVAELVDTVLLVALAGAGDQLQGIKRGVLEIADLITVNKADGDRIAQCRAAARELAGAMRVFRPAGDQPVPEVLLCSAQDGTGVAELWDRLRTRHRSRTTSGELAARRRDQQVDGMWRAARARLVDTFDTHPAVRDLAAELTASAGLLPEEAADRLVAAFHRHPPEQSVDSTEPEVWQ